MLFVASMMTRWPSSKFIRKIDSSLKILCLKNLPIHCQNFHVHVRIITIYWYWYCTGIILLQHVMSGVTRKLLSINTKLHTHI